MRTCLYTFLLLIFASSCSRREALAKYLNKNKILHEELIADAVKSYHNYDSAMIVLKKIAANNTIQFSYVPDWSDTYISTDFDSMGNVTNYHAYDGHVNGVPQRLIQNFYKSTYHAIQLDSTGIFFAEEYISSFGEYEIGIYKPFDTARFNRDAILKKLPDNYYVFKQIVP